MLCHRSRRTRPFLCSLCPHLDALSTGDAEHACDQLGSPRVFVVGGDRVHDDAGVNVRVDDADGRDVLDGAFADGVKVGYGIEKNGEVGNDALGQRRFGPEEVDLVCEGAGEPLLANVVALRTYALGCLEDGRAEVGTGADKDDGPVASRDGPHERCRATEMGERALEVYDGDARTRSVGVRDKVGIEQRAVVAEVCSGSEKGGERQVAWGWWTV